MVKLAAPKLNALDKIRVKQRAKGILAYKPGKPDAPVKTQVKSEDLKGKYQGNCNRTACQRPGAIWYNHSTRKYYCISCAHELNYDRFNKADSMNMYGHLLCTEGQHDPEWNYEYSTWQKEIVRFPEEPKISDAGSLTLLRPTIERKYLDNFMAIYEEGKRYERCVLGRAFYNHFGLYKLRDQSSFRDLSEHDGDVAKARLSEIFEFN